MNYIIRSFSFLGGLGMFLYGMQIMAGGLENLSGNRIKNLINSITTNHYKGIVVGAIVTALIQSSSATMVMVVGMVNAGIMSLSQAAGVIMGANIGTTVTAWFVSMSEWTACFNPEIFAPLIVGLGAFCLLFTKNSRKKMIAEISIGFGILFIGLKFMSDAMEPLQHVPCFYSILKIFGTHPILGILAGAIVTAIIQSSSASIGILQTMAMQGVVGWNTAVFVTLGQNIGTCVTALLSSINTDRSAKQAAIFHFLFNFVGGIVMTPIFILIFALNPDFAHSRINSIQISIFHTVFNIMNTCILLPFIPRLVDLTKLFVKERKIV